MIFIGSEFLAYTYRFQIESFVQGQGSAAKFFFIFMAAAAVIIPIWSNIFLLPVGAIAWGPFETALLCITGWQLGSMVSFYIAKKYQELLLKKYPHLAKYEFIDTLISSKHPSLSLVFLRMTFPVDVLSYSLGIFSSRVSAQQNAITTLIGITPFAFLFSYAGNTSLPFQIILVSTTGLFFLGYVAYQSLRKRP